MGFIFSRFQMRKGMELLVCIARTPDTAAPIAFTEDGKKFRSEGVQFIINPYDEFALARAIELKEEKGAKVTVITVDGSEGDSLLRKALAIGADEAIRIDRYPEDAYVVAREIARWIQEQTRSFDIIFTGKETIDYNGAQTGGLLAEFLGISFVPETYKLYVEGDGQLKIVREIEGGRVTLTLSMPAVISAVEYLAEPRLPSMMGIVKARSKPLHVIPADSSIVPLSQVEKHQVPEKKTECQFIDPEEVEKLVDILHREIKVL